MKAFVVIAALVIIYLLLGIIDILQYIAKKLEK